MRARTSWPVPSTRRCSRVPQPVAARSVDPEAAARLRALGYVSGGGSTRPAGAAQRDPKDGIRLLPHLNRGMSAARTEPDVAIQELTAVLKEDPGLLMARRTRAVAYAAAGKPRPRDRGSSRARQRWPAHA